jgi:hypothetical protein
MRAKPFRKVSPVSVVATALVLGGMFAIFRPALTGGERQAEVSDCVLNAEGECVPGLPSGSLRLYPTSPGPVLTAEEACQNVAYLCAALETEPRIVIRRWRDFDGTIVVHIPVPRMEDATMARRLQRAASAGVRLWNGYPFPILVDDRGTRQAHFAVQWQQGVTGNQIGLARTSWHPASGLQVRSLQLAIRNPFVPSQIISDRQIRLTAMHEMGHALGLPHSDSPRDVMYPTSTATALSAQDYVAMEALYAFEDGTEIVR